MGMYMYMYMYQFHCCFLCVVPVVILSAVLTCKYTCIQCTVHIHVLYTHNTSGAYEYKHILYCVQLVFNATVVELAELCMWC